MTKSFDVTQDCFVHYDYNSVVNPPVDDDTNWNGKDILVGFNDETEGSWIWYEKMRGFFRFDTAQIPSGSDIQSATLSIYVIDVKGQTGWKVQVFNATSSWNEQTITWDNKPSGSGSTETNAPKSTGWFDIDVTGNVQKAVDDNSHHGFYLRSDGENLADDKLGIKAYFKCEDKPNSNAAYLEVKYH